MQRGDFLEKVVAVVGPTAVGKSALGLKLAQKFNGEIISGDSMQIYRGLDIGTAKDSPEELSEVPHHLVDISDVTERYTVKDFQQKARRVVENLAENEKNSFVVGGTGFYLNSLIQNLNLGGKADGDNELRKELLKIEKNSGIDGLVKVLRDEDPLAMKTIDISNARRVIRAIEVHRETGKSIVDQNNGNQWAEFYLIGLTDDRDKLYARINSRVDKMVEMGLLDEVRPVYDNRDQIPQAKNGIGYKELFPYFEGTATLESCLDEIKKNSRHFAKRQLTYFRNQMDVDWYNISEEPDYQTKIENRIKGFLGGYNG
ncbi:tRNA isopentenyltransferase (tRNA delta(2)-isopentenylpyrophosphate transferase) (IPP transferase) [Companilactobacillus nodensis DSM 19682 = JCM 14932 = NBRC 107160]|uniref:tRNA dimethylallyltransferase n=1 Tax=Companilactobacillus nodensis DSM 19682 = JCM 14932 = NBRC 107160 TaxID=1423775 RepID=A0A0R1K8N7_9LACO|nr:tRNA isopentenyltransferase (tRNA delta(2)-isopentenylpyrophosphate transferase) (IPP transferase) [Companilactobacillus nodensis DSM 19682 = JCM 14932 = NBRC 107160]